MRTLCFGITILALLAFTAPTLADDDDDDSGRRTVTVMTRNVYHGVNAELFAVPTATSVPDLLSKVAAVYQGYFDRNFPERADALAAEIKATKPDLIGLQEAVLVRTDSPADGSASPATTVALDYVQILLDALRARGMHYEVIVQNIGLDAELPSALGFDVRHTDREVILARADRKGAAPKLTNPQAGTFLVNCQFPGPLGAPPVVIRRGWAAVDATVRRGSFRFVTTHLDGDCLSATFAIQHAQAAEVLASPAATDLPVIYVGDLNSRADGTGTASYSNALAAGFVDAWTEAGSGDGLTCCQAADLLNPLSILTQRIDFVLFRGDFIVRAIDILGEDPGDQTPSGLWPADHAGVVAEIQLLRR